MTATQMERATTSKTIQGPDPLAQKLLRGYLHKTSNSLCGIKGYAGLILANEDSTENANRWARKILREIDRMEEVFRSVGDLTHGASAFRSGCDIPGVLARSMAAALDSNPGMQINLTDLPEGQLLLPEADLQLVLKEILNNSAEAQKLSQVSISGQVEITGRVVLRISDNGPGMGPALLEQATDPFVTTRDGHHGVGLTRVETILDMHGLAWSLISHPGHGTSITLEVAESLILNPDHCLTRKKGK